MNKYKIIIFDMDGTLADTSPGILNSVRYVQEKMKLKPISLEQMYSHVGPPMEESYQRNFGLSGEALKKAVSLHKEYAIIQGYKEISWYDEIFELLDNLQKFKVTSAIATLKAHQTMMKILEKFDVENKFDIVIGMNSENPMTKAQMLEYCIKKAGCSKSEAVLIGDSKYDAIGAQEAEIDFIAVTYGFGFKTENDVDDFHHVAVCKSVSELKNTLNFFASP